MLLTIATTHRPARDLGYLLHKHPDRIHEFKMPYGKCTVVFQTATDDLAVAALLVDIDPIRLATRRTSRNSGLLSHYVNDWPYSATSLMSVAIGRAFGTAMSGRSDGRPELVSKQLPMAATIGGVRIEREEDLAERLFAPLGYRVSVDDAGQVRRGSSPRITTVRLEGSVTVKELLEHLYVLIPVLDNRRHYPVGGGDVDRLLDKGGTWLPVHAERELIARRYLRYRRELTREALDRLAELDGDRAGSDEEDEAQQTAPVPSLAQQRIDAIVDLITRLHPRTVLDLGCGEGRLLDALRKSRGIRKLVGVDASSRSLERAARRLHLDRTPPRQADRIKVIQGALTYRDARLSGFDAAIAMEVIEHFDRPRLEAFERVVFNEARPDSVIITTPNREYNALFGDGAPPQLRHPDHRFEFTRSEFAEWAAGVGERGGYSHEILPVGEPDPELGPPTMLAVFTR